jgi:hypothetical protein
VIDDSLGEQTRRLCHQSGWEFYERGNGVLAITLDVPGQFCQAYAYASSGSYRVAVTLQQPREVDGPSHRAMAVFLLAATSLVRTARATLVEDPLGQEYRWEVAWPELPATSAFHQGLIALSIACRLTTRELLALADTSIADTYLSLWGRSPQ